MFPRHRRLKPKAPHWQHGNAEGSVNQKPERPFRLLALQEKWAKARGPFRLYYAAKVRAEKARRAKEKAETDTLQS